MAQRANFLKQQNSGLWNLANMHTSAKKQKKRFFRRLWISRISAACKLNDLNYSKFINGLKKANIVLNRKVVSEMTINSPLAFKKLCDQAKKFAA